LLFNGEQYRFLQQWESDGGIHIEATPKNAKKNFRKAPCRAVHAALLRRVWQQGPV